MQKPQLTVVLCSHNPRRDYLQRTLNSLRAQTLPQEEWEFLLIDNASNPPLSGAWDLSWHPNARHIVENTLGLAAARERGMKESVSDLLVFVDDDTPLSHTYLAQALEIKDKWPMLGVWGSGSVIPEYELEPAEDLKDLMSFFAIRVADKPHWSNVYPCIEANPWGAGSCVRAKVADAYRRMTGDSSIWISGRKGSSRFSSEDIEIAWVACDIGLGMGLFPELSLTHLISKERVSREYILKIIEGWKASEILLAYKWKGHLPSSPLRPRGLLSFLKNMIVQKGINRHTYLARIRGTILARSIIAASRPKLSSHQAIQSHS
jgi:glycosyltransferase involved in cell wall biosynthesis